jgi:RND family efflux transporter MFP subunit
MRLTLAALKSPFTVIVAALMLAAIGVFALPRMATDLLPQFRIPAVQVLTLYPGMPAPVVEADITSRLERWTGQSNGISRQVSRSLTGVSVVRDYFREDPRSWCSCGLRPAPESSAPSRSGDRVRSGQVLATLSVPGLSAQAEAAVASSEAARHETEMRGDIAGRTASIAERNSAAISEQKVIAARNAVASAQARATSASAEARRLIAAPALGAGGASDLVNDTRIVAPFDGVVVARRKDRGTSVSPGDVVLEVARVDQLRIRLEIPEAEAVFVRQGAPIVATLPTLGGRRIDAKVSRFAPALDARTRMLPVEVDVPNADGSLVAGVRTEVRLADRTREGVLVVPSEALLQEGADVVVYVAGSGVARRRTVRPGYDNGIAVEIQEGITVGDVVLVGGRGLLRDGVRVEVAR